MIKSLDLSKSRKFNNLTKINILKEKKDIQYDKWPLEWKTIYYKAYPRMDQILLPKPISRKFDLYDSLLQRESTRDFSKVKVNFQDCADLLYYSAGIKGILKKDLSEKRMYPSAGGRYPLEVYIFSLNTEGLKEGAYHYHLKTHSLEEILLGPIYDKTIQQFQQSWIRTTGLLIVVTAIFDRSEMKYGDRSYRHIMTEYGHMAQNLYLVGNSLGLGMCSIGGFCDDGLNEILDIDGVTESVIGAIAVGAKKKKMIG